MTRTKKIIATVVGVAALAAGGSAFTASNTVPGSVAGYGTSTITGATAKSVNYTLNATGTTITDATIVFDGDVSARTVKAGFGTDALTACTVAAYDSGNDETTASCTGYTQDTELSASFAVAVS